jgi:hypothetical protein
VVDLGAVVKLVSEYANAKCAAIVDGKRCRGRWASAYPTVWASDATAGPSVTGPYVVLCRRCRRRWERGHLGRFVKGKGYPSKNPLFRMRVTNGWFGPFNEYGYGTAVWASKTGWKPAPKWWEHRRTQTFGEGRKDAA